MPVEKKKERKGKAKGKAKAKVAKGKEKKKASVSSASSAKDPSPKKTCRPCFAFFEYICFGNVWVEAKNNSIDCNPKLCLSSLHRPKAKSASSMKKNKAPAQKKQKCLGINYNAAPILLGWQHMLTGLKKRIRRSLNCSLDNEYAVFSWWTPIYACAATAAVFAMINVHLVVSNLPDGILAGKRVSSTERPALNGTKPKSKL